MQCLVILILLLTPMSESNKRLMLFRHSTTEMNEYMSTHHWGSPNFKDPFYYDTILSENGRDLAISRHLNIIENDESLRSIKKIELIIASPLTRALDTCNFVLSKDILPHVPRLALPLAAERLYLASDVGKNKNDLIKQFPHWDFSELPESPWWYNQDLDNLNRDEIEFDYSEGKYHPEPKSAFHERMIQLKKWLAAREENHIAIVSHWGVLRALTGKEFKNVEIMECDFNSLLSDKELNVEN